MAEALLRRERRPARETLVEAIGRALDAVSGRDAQSWFAHRGYPLRGLLP